MATRIAQHDGVSKADYADLEEGTCEACGVVPVAPDQPYCEGCASMVVDWLYATQHGEHYYD